MDPMVVVMFENRSFDNLLGRLYQPGERRHSRGWSANSSATRITGAEAIAIALAVVGDLFPAMRSGTG